MEFSLLSHWHFLFLFKRLAEQSTARQLFTQVWKVSSALWTNLQYYLWLLLWPWPCCSLRQAFLTGDNFLRDNFVTIHLLQGTMFYEQLIVLCRTMAILVHFRHSWLQWHVFLYLMFPQINLSGDQNVITLHIPACFQEKKVRSSSSVLTSLVGAAAASHTLCEVNSVRFWPCTFLPRHQHCLEFRALETSLEAFDTPQYPLAVPTRDFTINNVRYNVNRTSYIPRSIINYRSKQAFLSHSHTFFCFNSSHHWHFCDMIFTPVCVYPDCHGIILH